MGVEMTIDQPKFFYLVAGRPCVNWAKNVFVRNAKLYELVLEGMWKRGEEDALAISSLLQDMGLAECRVLDVPCGIGRVGIPLSPARLYRCRS